MQGLLLASLDPNPTFWHNPTCKSGYGAASG